jgi:hypothetical protein
MGAHQSASTRCPPTPCGRHGQTRSAVTRQMFSEPDGSPLGPADQLGEPSNLFVSHCRENVVFRQARNPGKPRNTVHCNDCTVRPGSGSTAQVERTIWSQRARAILIRLGDDNADCFVSPARSNQRKMGLGCTSGRQRTPCIGPSCRSCIYSKSRLPRGRRTSKLEKPDHISEPGRALLSKRSSKSSEQMCAFELPPSRHNTAALRP